MAAAKAKIEEILPGDLAALEGVALIDVREVDEWEQGIIAGALHVPRGTLEGAIVGAAPDTSTSIVLYCAGGSRSALATLTLNSMGYANVRSLSGGFSNWKSSGFSWELPGGFTTDQRSRYARHIKLPEVGESGQQKLLDARVLIIGAGGLRVACGPLPGGGRRRHNRHCRQRSGRCNQFAAPDPPRPPSGRREEGRGRPAKP